MDTFPTAATRTLAIPEILEHILLYLLADLSPPTNRDDCRSHNVQTNARILLHILRCTEIASLWRTCITRSSPFLRRALFLSRECDDVRSWDQQTVIYPNQQQFYRCLAYSAPVLNPVTQMAFDGYRFRYWRSGLGAEGPRHHAYLILSRRHVNEARIRIAHGYGKNVRNMFLAQPPPTEMCAAIWERRFDPVLFPSRTIEIKNPQLLKHDGVTLDDVLRHAGQIFDEHSDLISIKVTTV